MPMNHFLPKLSAGFLLAAMAAVAVAAPKDATVPGAPAKPRAYTQDGVIYVETAPPEDDGG